MMCGRAECRRFSRPLSTWEPPLLLQEPPFSCIQIPPKETRYFKQAWQNFSLFLYLSIDLSSILSPLSSFLSPLSNLSSLSPCARNSSLQGGTARQGMAGALISRTPQRLMTEMMEAEDKDMFNSVEASPTSFSALGDGRGSAIRRGRDATGWGSFLDQQIPRAEDEGDKAGGMPGAGLGVTEQIVNKYAAAAAMRDIQRLQRKKPSHNMAQFTVGNEPGCTHRTLSAAAKSAGKAGAVIFLREDREEERETVEICSEVIIQRDPTSPQLPNGEKTRLHFHGLACCIRVQGSTARATLVDVFVESTGLPAPAAVGCNQMQRVVFKPLVHAQQRGGSCSHYSQPTSSGLGAGNGGGWQVPCCLLVCGDGRAHLEGCRVSCMGGDGVRVEGPTSVLVAVGASSIERCGR